MTHDEKIALLVAWQTAVEASNKHMDAIDEVLGLSLDSPLYEAVWGIQAAYTKALSVLLGDKSGLLVWYQSENNFGRNGYGAGPKDNPRLIKTFDDLLWLIGE